MNETKIYAEGIEGVVIADGLGLEMTEGIIGCFTANRLPKVALKLPEAEALRIFGQPDGAPALGWVSRLRREGTKLIADFTKVPRIVARALREGSRPRLEVAHDYKDPESRRWEAALRAITIGGVPLAPWGNLDEMSIALMSEDSTRRTEAPSIDELTRCRISLTGEEYGVAARGVLAANPEAARQYLRIPEGPR